jgi:hypothetical protein
MLATTLDMFVHSDPNDNLSIRTTISNEWWQFPDCSVIYIEVINVRMV